MAPEISRRAWLSATGGVVALSTGGLARASEGRDCEAVAELRSEVEARRETVSDLEARERTLAERTETLRAEIEAARDRFYEESAEYPESVRAEAGSVGRAARGSVVTVELFASGGTAATGTGWFVEDDLVLTNSHVIDGAADAEEIFAWTVEGERIDLSFVDRVDDQQPDVGLLRAASTREPLPTGDSSALSAGEELVAVGHPGGVGYWVVSLGEFRERTSGYASESLVTSVPSLTGNSGSPTMTLDGDVVGMLWGSNLPGRDSDVPKPADPSPHTMPLGDDDEDVMHVPIETALDRVEAWT